MDIRKFIVDLLRQSKTFEETRDKCVDRVCFQVAEVDRGAVCLEITHDDEYTLAS